VVSKKPTTTHTVDMAQIAELNARLSGHVDVSASALGLEGATVHGSSHGPLPGTAVLVRVCWQGAPEFPDIHGHFASSAGADATVVVDLHTVALRELSHRLHAHHIWGQGSLHDPGVGPAQGDGGVP
jgi:hypothetical protein